VHQNIYTPSTICFGVVHSVLRLDATRKKGCITFDFKFKKNSIKQQGFFADFLKLLLVEALFSKFEIFETFLIIK
jgi:hypothetical protein